MKKTLLMILDGWGNSPDPNVSAVAKAHTPYIDQLYKDYPHAELRTDGVHVGLPEGQMGNSEVGHMNLGAGRIVYQDLAKISLAFSQGTIVENPVLQKAFETAKERGTTLHFLGLVSDGGVHAHIDHLEGFLDLAQQSEVPDVCVHAFTDGRDVDPKSGAGFIGRLLEKCSQTGAQLASVTGRYFAMDRDQRWERTNKAYEALTAGKGELVSNFVAAIESQYSAGVTDEFLEPLIAQDSEGNPLSTLQKDDVVVFINFRTDRGRQLTRALTQAEIPKTSMKPIQLHFNTLTNYDASFEDVNVLFDKENLEDTLGETLAQAGKTQIRIAETEKYPHVTFFFNGGREEPFTGEERILCPSPKVATYDLKPEMSAFDLRDALLPKIQEGHTDFICLNFANPDMVGHTGDFDAAVKACETVDQCAATLIDAALEAGYSILVIADHGNCETMRNPDGSPHTAHTTNPVPVILVEEEKRAIQSGILGDIAPTLLDLMGIEQPQAMTQQSLLVKNA
ncbi:MAG: 2,3-bisphosphoglycerate-independent phosphoglycerate mutase [Flavobacteriaceae bacterium]